MDRLSTALSIEPTSKRTAVYWDALCDLAIEPVIYACQHAARYWRPTSEERLFPVPLTLREYAKLYYEEQRRLATQQAQAAGAGGEGLLPQWSTTPDHEGLMAIREVLEMLEKKAAMAGPAWTPDELAHRRLARRRRARSEGEPTAEEGA
jgi:hypothetical protein